jgi:hypothetical protein
VRRCRVVLGPSALVARAHAGFRRAPERPILACVHGSRAAPHCPPARRGRCPPRARPSHARRSHPHANSLSARAWPPWCRYRKQARRDRFRLGRASRSTRSQPARPGRDEKRTAGQASRRKVLRRKDVEGIAVVRQLGPRQDPAAADMASMRIPGGHVEPCRRPPPTLGGASDRQRTPARRVGSGSAVSTRQPTSLVAGAFVHETSPLSRRSRRNPVEAHRWGLAAPYA